MQQDKESMEQFFDDSWGHMHGLLDEHFPVKEKNKRRFVIWWWYGMTTILLVVGAVYWFNQMDGAGGSPTTEIIETISTPSFISDGQEKQNVPNEIVAETKKIEPADIQQKKVIINSKNEQPVTLPKQKANKNFDEVEHHLVRSSSVEFEKISDIGKTQLESHQDLVIVRDAILIPTPNIKKVKKMEIVPSLPTIKPNPLFTAEEALQLQKFKIKKKFYFELYTGASVSSLGYSSGFVGMDIGRPLTNRLSFEIGLGYRTILTGLTYIDSTSKALDFNALESDYTFESLGSTIGFSLFANKESLRLHLVELPLKLRYQITPRWSVYGDVIGVYQFAQKIPDAVIFKNYSQQFEKKAYLPVANLASHAYVGLGGGVSFGKNHWRLNAGYNNWALFKPDNQYYLGLKYRF